MKIVLSTVLCVIIITFATSGFCTTYYVKNGGNDNASGLSDNDAWATVAKVNSFNFSDGDIVCFKRGCTFNDAGLTIPSVDNFTIQDYGSGNKPKLDGDSNRPIRYGGYSNKGGTADGNITNHLIDTGSAPFTEWGVQVGDVVVNISTSNEDLQGYVIAVNSDSDLTLNADIFPNGNENYRIYGPDYAVIQNLTIKNIDISGQDFGTNKDKNLVLFAVNGATIDGVDGNGHEGGNDPGQKGNHAIQFLYCRGTIEVKNCTLYNWGKDDLDSRGADIMGISVFRPSDGTYNIHDNTIHDISADGIQLYRDSDLVSYNIYDNTFYNFGEQAIDIKGASNFNIYGNTFYTEVGFDGGAGGSGGGTPTLITVGNPTTNSPNNNIDIYENKFGSSNTMAIIIGGPADNVQIHDNWIEDTAGLVKIGSDVTNSAIYANVMLNPRQRDSGDGREMGGCYLSGDGCSVAFYNNTIVDDDGDSNWLLFSDGGTWNIKNNIFYMGGSEDTDYCMKLEGGGTKNISYNCYYSNSLYRIRDGNTYYDSTDQAIWRAAGHTGTLFADPLFNNAANGDFSLSPSSPCQSDGEQWGAIQNTPISAPNPPSKLRIK